MNACSINTLLQLFYSCQARKHHVNMAKKHTAVLKNGRMKNECAEKE